MAVLLALITFLILGGIIKMILDRFELPDRNAVDEDGEVIEKSVEETDEEGEESVTEKPATEESSEETPE